MDIRREFETGGFSCLSCHLAASAQLGRVLVEQIRGDLAGWDPWKPLGCPSFTNTMQSRQFPLVNAFGSGQSKGRRLPQGLVWRGAAVDTAWLSLVSRERRALFVRDATTKS